MTPHDHPDLTAHVLGELDAEHAEAMAQWIAENPTALAEATEMSRLADGLRSTASMPKVALHPHQREAILSGPQLVRKMVEAAAQKPKRRSIWQPIFSGVGRMAAAALFLLVGFMAGSRFTATSPKSSVTKADPPKSEDSKATPVQQPFRAKEVPVVASTVVAAAKVDESALKSAAKLPEAMPPKAPDVIIATVARPFTPATAKAVAKPAAWPETRVTDGALVSTTKAAVAQVVLEPSKTRPSVAAPKDILAAAAPAKLHEKPLAVPAPKKPELLIHSWKAEVAACPWDESRRLLRLSIQMPGQQPAAQAELGYPVQVAFQQAYVRSYRQLCQRTVAPQNPDEAALQVTWYEVVPNGAAADRSGKTLATVSLPNAKFTTAAMGPFEGATQLQVVDHGISWNEASDDFVFETSVTGFGLLLKGGQQSPALNQALVLKLAEGTLKNDRHGERARFVKLVKDAQKAAGL